MASNAFGTVGWQGFTPAKPAVSNPFTTITNTKSPEVDSRLTDLFKQFDTLRGLGSSSLTDYTKALNQNTPQLKGFAMSDIGALNDVASGRTAEDLARIRANRANAIKLSADRARAGVSGALAQTQLASGGGGRSLGSSSYMQKLALNKLSDIEAKAAADDADAQRADYLYNQGLRMGTLGQRGGYLDALAGRSLLPLKATTDQYGANLNQLGTLLQQYLANNFIGLQKPYGVDYGV